MSFLFVCRTTPPTPATNSLRNKVNGLASEVGVRLQGAGLFRVGVKEDEILPDMQDYLLLRAQDGLDMVRMHVFSHVVWLYHVNEAIKGHYPGQWTAQAQRWMWLSSLQNGPGQQAVGKIYEVYLNQFLPLADFNSREHVKELMDLVKTVLVGYDGLPAPNSPVVFAFDEIGFAKNIGSGVWYHSGDFAALRHSTRIAELVSKSANSRSEQVADLFLAFKIIMSTLYDRHRVRAVLADTNFSIFDLEREQDKSPLNANLKPWQDMHAMTRDDMVAELVKYFDITKGDLATVADALAPFMGRPFFFYTDFLKPYLLNARHDVQTPRLILSSWCASRQSMD